MPYTLYLHHNAVGKLVSLIYMHNVHVSEKCHFKMSIDKIIRKTLLEKVKD